MFLVNFHACLPTHCLPGSISHVGQFVFFGQYHTILAGKTRQQALCLLLHTYSALFVEALTSLVKVQQSWTRSVKMLCHQKWMFYSLKKHLCFALPWKGVFKKLKPFWKLTTVLYCTPNLWNQTHPLNLHLFHAKRGYSLQWEDQHLGFCTPPCSFKSLDKLISTTQNCW